jgi:hypothetical protein
MENQQGGFLRQLKFGFQNIPIDDQDCIPTREFLRACEEFVRIFDVLGSIAFLPVKMDIYGNIEVGEKCLLRMMVIMAIHDFFSGEGGVSYA